MTEYEVEFAEAAEADFDSIQDFIAEDNPLRALTFIDELRDAAMRFLAVTPNAGTRIGSRRYFAKAGYVLVYEVDEPNSIVRVVMVTEGHRNWRSAFEP